MHVDGTEKKWIILSFAMAFAMMGILTAYALNKNIHPPSNVEVIDSTTLHLSDEFNEDNLGIKKEDDGSLRITMVAARYGFFPHNMTVPVDTPIKIRIASADVLHGVHTSNTNFNTMIVPGYISEVNTTFRIKGNHPMFCNEYCGLGHDYMWSQLNVVSQEEFAASFEKGDK
ncbi:MAG TPA: cytochrome C oxidase subunit II [Leucothrix mucor]|nr:cytochrome C oxidase subunit II [Leucothrix mucor]